MASADPREDSDLGARPAGLEAPPPPSADPNQKTSNTSDPQANDPGNGAD